MKRLLIHLIIGVAGVISMNCEPAIDPIRTFTISEGEHYASQRSIETLQNSVLSFQARFNNTAMYDLGDIALQSNKNKLLGFSACNSMHHENSARFAWQWFNDRLEIYAYCYVNSQRIEKFVGVADLNVFSRYKIEIKPSEYLFTLNDELPVSIPRVNTGDRGIYYMLWPYFGGSIPAPHEVTIDLMID
jgi:hypothetical protein